MEVHWAHIEPRRKKAIRWHELNSLCLCAGCHSWFDSQITAGRTWLASTFPERVEWLAELVEGTPRSQTLFTMTPAEMAELVEQLKGRLKELKDGEN